MNMEPMSLRQLILNNPEWFGVLSNALFAAITVTVIVWQVLVMRRQARNSDRHERSQNQLIRLEHEHEWVLQKNRDREQLLKLARDLDHAAGSLEHEPSDGDSLHWEEVEDRVNELKNRLSILDVATFTTEYDDWFPALEGYVETVLNAVINESSRLPSPSTREAIAGARKRYEPSKIFIDLEKAIRMEFFDFKDKWDRTLSTL